ncbi:MAG TPA: methyltransferase domain-containing protein [Polyangiaceae bacterium]|nr:methyltransferase domain-containing protein [Polyangiaceae bacterium]
MLRPDRYSSQKAADRDGGAGSDRGSGPRDGSSGRRVLVFFPTYNEAGNVERLIREIRHYLPGASILVVDDASPDGTGAILDRLATELSDLEIVHRPGKLGLGSAHKLAMLRARDEGFDALVTMDADFSHHPRYLPEMLSMLESADFVTGSRYTGGGKSDQVLSRTLISRTANLFAKAALGLPLEENTTMFRGFTAELLRRLDFDALQSEGYSFAVESLNLVAHATDKLAEFPIHFENRTSGASKISRKEILRAVLTIERLGVQRLLGKSGVPRTAPRAAVACVVCGGTYHAEVYPARDDSAGMSASDISPYSCATHSSRTHGQILKCLRCGLVFMRPKLSSDALVGEYQDAVDPVYLEHIQARETTFRENLRAVQKYIRRSDRVLEVGSYCGAFLRVAKDAGFDVTGLEPSAWAAEASRSVTDAPVVCGTLDDLPPDLRAFDVVVAWDVLEHFADPVAELRKIAALLPEGGTLLFSTLMIDNWFPKLAGRYWPWLMDMHLFYFTEETIRNVLRETGFELVDEGKYTHVVTLEYLLGKLGTLGVPLAEAAAKTVEGRPFARAEIPFRFGDIKYFVCRKVDTAPRSAARPILEKPLSASAR